MKVVEKFVEWSNRLWFFIIVADCIVLGYTIGIATLAVSFSFVSVMWVVSNFWFWNTIIVCGVALILMMYAKWDAINPNKKPNL